MKKIMISITIVLLSGVVGAADKNVKEQFRMAKNTAGYIKVGMPIDDILSQFNNKSVKLVDLQNEGQFTPALEIYLSGIKKGHPSLVLEIECGKNDWIVQSILVNDRRFKTNKGVGVGSSLGDLRKNYKIDNLGGGEGYIIARVNEIGMSFELDKSHIPAEWFKTADGHLLPNNIKIISVYIFD